MVNPRQPWFSVLILRLESVALLKLEEPPFTELYSTERCRCSSRERRKLNTAQSTLLILDRRASGDREAQELASAHPHQHFRLNIKNARCTRELRSPASAGGSCLTRLRELTGQAVCEDETLPWPRHAARRVSALATEHGVHVVGACG